MSDTTGYVLTIAGHDPSGGAGILADVRAIESLGSRALSVCTALTYQTENSCRGYRSVSLSDLRQQLLPLFENYPIKAVKIGLFPCIYDLCETLRLIRGALGVVPVVWDPVLKTSSGYIFHDLISESELKTILSHCTVATPNREEVALLSRMSCPDKSAERLSQHAPILLKGGHDQGDMVVDKLYDKELVEVFRSKRFRGVSVHGSGCVHSSALATYLACGDSLLDASKKAFSYMQQLFGFHNGEDFELPEPLSMRAPLV